MKTMLKRLLPVAMIILLLFALVACSTPEQEERDKYPVDHTNPDNIDKQYPEPTTSRKDAVVDRATDGMDMLLSHLDGETTSETGYFLGADMVFNGTDQEDPSGLGNSAFKLKLRANLYTYPYEELDEKGNPIYIDGVPQVREDDLKIHNELIKKSDIVLEWYDAMTNVMMIGFYFDGINANSLDPGNHLYLNLLGNKRRFDNFGDSVLYQQMVRLITKFNLNTLLDGSSSQEGSTLNQMNLLLKSAVTDNFKEVLNGDVTSIFFKELNLSARELGVTTGLTEYLNDFFSPFEDKLDPLSNKYLGFKLSTLGNITIDSLFTSMQFYLEDVSILNADKEREVVEMMTGMVLDANGVSEVSRYGKRIKMPYKLHADIDYDLEISTDIVIGEKHTYKPYVYGSYEYVGEMFIPMLNLETDALIRTDMNEVDNTTNQVFAQFYDKANGQVMIGAYYKDEKTYLDITNFEKLYGGIKFSDLGLPKAYKEGFNLAELLKFVFDAFDTYLVLMVDSIFAPGESEDYSKLQEVIMSKIESTMKTDDDPTSRNTIKITIDMELIRAILTETSESKTTFTNQQIVSIINDWFNIDLESYASLFGVSLSELMDTTYFEITYDVDEYSIRIDLYSSLDVPEGEKDTLIVRLDLWPNKIGEKVRIEFPKFDGFKPLQEVMTYSGYLTGEINFAANEEVDLSELMGAFIGDISGKNTQYVLPRSAQLYFELYYDQYIRDQILNNGRFTRSGRSALNLLFYELADGKRKDLFRVYANDIAFNTYAPVEELGYVWVDLICAPNVPKLKVREDLFLETFYEYLGADVSDYDSITVGLTTLIQALMEKSWVSFEPEVIRVNTSNDTIKSFFRVDELFANVTAQIGFRQRVFNIDELETQFAMYTVADLKDLSGETRYHIPLHKSITVYFDFGDHREERQFLFDYNEESLRTPTTRGTDATRYYFPATKGQFMGAIRTYKVSITDPSAGYSDITNLLSDHLELEPIGGSFPTSMTANYGDQSSEQKNYPANIQFYAYFDLGSQMYVVINDDGYHILYDQINDVYVVELGTNLNYDKAYALLARDSVPVLNADGTQQKDEKGQPLTQSKPIYRYQYEDINSNFYTYNIKNEIAGLYMVDSGAGYLAMYDAVRNRYITQNTSDFAKATADFSFREMEIVTDKDGNVVSETPIIVEPDLYAITGLTFGGKNAVYDLKTGYYVVVADDGTRALTKDGSSYLVKSLADVALAEAAGLAPAFVQQDLAYRDHAGAMALFSGLEWGSNTYRNIEWLHPTWENMPITGGLFILEVVIGGADKMATYRQFITARVKNRLIDATEYVSVLVDGQDEKVLAPVVSTIEVDPYAFLVAHADYENNLTAMAQREEIAREELRENFINWFFSYYLVQFSFVPIYHNENDTEAESNFYSWAFEDSNNPRAAYTMADINNRVPKGTKQSTYVLHNFFGQIIALKVEVLARTVLGIDFKQDLALSTYSADALERATWTIPNKPELLFEETDANGHNYTLNFSDYSKGASTILASLPQPLTGQDIGAKSGANSAVLMWSNPVVDNARLKNDNPPKPFKDSDSNKTTALLNFDGFVNPSGTWFLDDWFFEHIVTITIDLQDREVALLEHDLSSTKYEAHNIIFGSTLKDGYYTAAELGIETENKNGLFLIDPYRNATWALPTRVHVVFNPTKSESRYYVKSYAVSWTAENEVLIYGDDGSAQVRATEIDKEGPKYFKLNTIIGDADDTIALKAVGVKMSGYIDAFQFYDKNGNVLTGALDQAPNINVGDNAADDFNKHDNYTYIYYVDTFKRFAIPAYMTIAFDDGTTRTYDCRWMPVSDTRQQPIWAPGVVETLRTELGFGLSTVIRIPLRYFVANREVDGSQADAVVLDNYDNTLMGGTVTMNHQTKTIVIDGMDVSNEALFLALSANGIQTVYDVFAYLFAKATFSLTAIGETPNFPNEIKAMFANGYTQTDCLNAWEFLRKFDSQLARTEAGYIFQYQLGQGALAYDYKVTIKNLIGVDEVQQGALDTKSHVVFAFDQQTGAPNYSDDKPFVLNDELTLRLMIDGSWQEVEEPIQWYVALAVAGVDEAALCSLYNINPGDKLSQIDWATMQSGGAVWVTGMLSDGSRLYRHIEIASFGDGSFSSVDRNSVYSFTDGKIVVESIYMLAATLPTLTGDNIPKLISAGGKYEIRVPAWTLNEQTLAKLRTLKYNDDDMVDAPFATARALNEELTLYITVKSSEVLGIAYRASGETDNRRFESGKWDAVNSAVYDPSFVNYKERNYMAFDVDAYHNSGYNGVFAFPESVVLYLKRDNGTVFAYEVALPELKSVSAEAVVKTIPYDIKGHKQPLWAAEGTANNVPLRATIGSGVTEQELYIMVQFYDKTITGVQVELPDSTKDDPKYDDANKYSLDPYGNREVRKTVQVLFDQATGGKPYVYTLEDWVRPSDYELKYNTYQRILKNKSNKYFVFSGALSSEGLLAQTYQISVYVADRVANEWTLLGLDKADTIATVANPNASHHYTDPFEGKASDLPSTFASGKMGADDNETYIKGLKVVWKFADRNITAAGTTTRDFNTGRYGMVVTGHIQNEEYGQPISIRVYINRWNYQVIREPNGNGGYNIVEDELRLMFRPEDGAFAVGHLQVSFVQTDPTLLEQGIYNETVLRREFYPQTENQTSPYLLEWDQAALNHIKAYPESVRQGSVRLVNRAGENKLTLPLTAMYQYERFNITDLMFTYTRTHIEDGVLIEDAQVLLGKDKNLFAKVFLNPMSSSLPDWARTARAWGKSGNRNDVELGLVDVFWNESRLFGGEYWGGGIDVGHSVRLRYTKEQADGNLYVYEQEFQLMVVYLDMSPEVPLQATYSKDLRIGDLPNMFGKLEDGEIVGGLTARVEYTFATYIGKVNPYGSQQYDNISSLLSAVAAQEALQGRRTYVVATASFGDDEQKIAEPSIGGNTLVYSQTVTIKFKDEYGTVTKNTNYLVYQITKG